MQITIAVRVLVVGVSPMLHNSEGRTSIGLQPYPPQRVPCSLHESAVYRCRLGLHSLGWSSRDSAAGPARHFFLEDKNGDAHF